MRSAASIRMTPSAACSTTVRNKLVSAPSRTWASGLSDNGFDHTIGLRFHQARFDNRQQCRGREGFAQATSCTELASHPQEIWCRHSLLRKDVTGNGNERHMWCSLMEHPHRLKAAHVRHKDIDNHQIEGIFIERVQTGLSAISDDGFITFGFDPRADRRANQQIVVYHENARHNEPPNGLKRSSGLVAATV